MEGLAILAVFFGFFTGIFWMVVGWRAMQAHEKIADSIEWIARNSAKQQSKTDQSVTSSES